jgi:hypothetical protein
MRAQVFVGVVGLGRDDLQPPPFARLALQDRRGPLTPQAAADEVIDNVLFAAMRMSAFGGGLKRSTQHFISDARDGVDSDGSKICSRFQRGGQGGGVVEPLAARIRSSTE